MTYNVFGWTLSLTQSIHQPGDAYAYLLIRRILRAESVDIRECEVCRWRCYSTHCGRSLVRAM